MRSPRHRANLGESILEIPAASHHSLLTLQGSAARSHPLRASLYDTGRDGLTQSRIPPLNFHLSTHGGQIAGRHGAVAASGCRNPTACSRYPAIRGCSTRSTRSCGSSRTASRAVCRRLRAARERGTAFLNQFTQTCNSKLILAIRQLLGALQVCAAPLPTPPRYPSHIPRVARR